MRTIVGPWVHGFPTTAYPAPNIDWLRETVRWFDRWLKDEPNGADAEPPLTWFHRDPTPPERFPKRLNGTWRAPPSWPPASPRAVRQFALDAGASATRRRRRRTGVDTFAHRPTAGVRGGSLCWGAGHPPNGLAADLRLEDDAGPTYVSEPLTEPLDVLGDAGRRAARERDPARRAPRRPARLTSRPTASIEQVSEGILNLTHRDSHADPTPLEPGRRYEVRVPLRAAGYRFPAGHRVYLGRRERPLARDLALAGRGRALDPSRPLGAVAPGAAARADRRRLPSSRRRFGAEAPHLAEIGSETSDPATWETVEDGGRVRHGSHARGGDDHAAGRRQHPLVGETLAMTASAREPGHGRFENACEYRLDRDGRQVDIVADGTTVATDDGVRDGRLDPGRPRRRAVLRARLARGDSARPAVTRRDDCIDLACAGPAGHDGYLARRPPAGLHGVGAPRRQAGPVLPWDARVSSVVP